MRRVKNIIGGILAVTLCGIHPAIVEAGPFTNEAESGAAAYRDGDYPKAVEQFQSAQKSHPENPALAYNLGNSRYMQGEYPAAAQDYAQASAQATTPDLQEKALFNSGNALFRQGKFTEAERAYKEALKLNPKDMDAKFNLEFTREKLKSKPPPKPDKNNKQKSDQGQDGKNSSPSANEAKDAKGSQPPDNKQSAAADTKQSNPPHKDSAKQGQASDVRPDKPQEQGQPASAQSGRDKPGMTREEAERWLRSLDENPQKLSRKQNMNDVIEGAAYKGKDW